MGPTMLSNHSSAAAPGSHGYGRLCQGIAWGVTCQGLQYVHSKCCVRAACWAVRRLSAPLGSNRHRELPALCCCDFTVRSRPRMRWLKVGAVRMCARASGRRARRARQPLLRVCKS